MEGLSPATVAWGTFRYTAASLLMFLLSVRLVSPLSAVTLQDGSNLVTGSAANMSSGKCGGGGTGDEEKQRREQGDILLNLRGGGEM